MMRMKKSRRRLTHLAAVNYCFVLGIAPPFVENRADDRRQGLTTFISVLLSFFLSFPFSHDPHINYFVRVEFNFQICFLLYTRPNLSLNLLQNLNNLFLVRPGFP